MLTELTPGLRVFHWLFLIVFCLSAIAQLNDPDALVWTLIYLLAAATCIDQLIGPRLPRLPVILLLCTLTGIVILLPEVAGEVSMTDLFDSLSMRSQSVEEAREIGGLTLIAIWCAISATIGRRVPRS